MGKEETKRDTGNKEKKGTAKEEIKKTRRMNEQLKNRRKLH